MTANRALSIPEILQHVLSDLAPRHYHYNPSTRGASMLHEWENEKMWSHPARPLRTLAMVARSCKHFLNPALDILWSHQTNVIALLSVLPTFRKERDGYTLVDRIQTQHLIRLQYYAHRVRCLDDPLDFRKIDDFVFVQLSQLLLGQPLMPRLQYLSYPLSPAIFVFISPQLRRVYLGGKFDQRGAIVFLNRLMEASPLLEAFNSSYGRLFTTPTLADVFANFRHLRYLSVGDAVDLDANGLVFIFTRLDLLGLTLDLPPASPLGIGNLSSAISHPLALRRLKITAKPYLVTNILSCLALTPLKTLYICYNLPPESGLACEEIWQSRFSRIPCLFPSLSTLRLEDKAQMPDPALLRKTSIFDPLLNLSALVHLILHLTLTLDFRTAAFCRMAKAWPKLETLVIESTGPTQITPSATFVVLENFALYCPNLRELSLRVCVSLRREEPKVMSHRLQKLYIDHPVSSAPDSVARCIDALFPFLDEIEGNDDRENDGAIEVDSDSDNDMESDLEGYGDSEYEETKWEEVECMVKTCQKTRKDHEKRLGIQG